MKLRYIKFTLLFTIILFVTPVYLTLPIAAQRDYWPTEEWQTSTPEEQGMSSAILNATSNYLEEDTALLHSLLVIRNGYIVFEEYFASYHENRRHIIFSCTKSITSTLIGIAIEEGYIRSTDDLILDYLENYTITETDPRKNLITIEDLLTMTSGLAWSEGGGDDDYFSMGFSDNWVEYVLNRPMIADPGETFEYNTGGSHLLAAILNISTGMTPLSFGEEYLFGPIGIDDVYWPTDTEGINNGGSDLGITPRDMARFGYLFLNNGSWDEGQIVPSGWVSEATSTKVQFNADTGYGFQWWTTPEMNLYSARGYHGQYIMVIPEYDLVVVTTADDPNTTNTIFHVLSNYILPSIDNFTPLSDDILLTVIVIVSIVAVIVVIAYFRKIR